MTPRWLLAIALVLGIVDLHAADPPVKRVAGVTTVYRHNAHADVILTRLLETDTLDGQGQRPRLELVSLYVDQVGDNDLSRGFAAKHGFRLSPTIADALTLGGDTLAVDGVLVIAEHGDYPRSPTGQIIYPKRRLMTEVFDVFRKTRRAVPVFSDKHLADNAADALWFYDTAKELNVPLMAGSSVTTSWRDPAIDIPRDAALKEIVVLSYGSLDAYGFHGLERLQELAERRRGGETGVASVRGLKGDAVWQAGRDGVYDLKLVDAAVATLKVRPPPRGKTLEDLVKEPSAFIVDYADGTRGTVLTLNGAVAEWAAAWRCREDDTVGAFVDDLHTDRPFMHFAHLLEGIERMLHTGQPAWPADRTLFTSIILDTALQSQQRNGEPLSTPDLHRSYQCRWNWRQPSDHGRSSQKKAD
jgi:hypothetical protein